VKPAGNVTARYRTYYAAGRFLLLLVLEVS